MLGALTYAELAAANPEAGGLYCYIRDGFGRAPAFLYGWCLFLVIASGTNAALARAFSRYLSEIIPLSPMGSTAVGGGHDCGGHRGERLGHAQKLRPAKLDHAHKNRHRHDPERGVVVARPSCRRPAGCNGHDAAWIFHAFEFWPGHDRGVMGLRRMAVRHLQRRRSLKAAENFSQGISDGLVVSDGALFDRQSSPISWRWVPRPRR